MQYGVGLARILAHSATLIGEEEEIRKWWFLITCLIHMYTYREDNPVVQHTCIGHFD